MPRLIPAIFGVLLVSAAAGVLSGDQTDERFLDGLRQRRLFESAETYCRDRLADPALSDFDRAQLTIQLARTYAQHAVNRPRAEREPLWRKARLAAAELVRADPQNARLVLVRLQDALTLLARGELARQEAEVGAAGAPSLEEARRQLRAAVALLKELDAEVARALLKAVPHPAGDELSEGELVSLQRNVRYQLARAYRNQGRSYADGSDDRINSLTQSLGQLSGISTTDPLRWQVLVDQLVCLRLLKRYDAAQRKLDALASAQPPPSVRLRARAEWARLELAAGDPQAALKVISQGREIAGQTSPDLDLAAMETCVALWEAARRDRDDRNAATWQQKAVALVHRIERLHGPYWTRRAEMLLARSASAHGGAGNLELDVLVTAAENHYRRKEYDEAVVAYARAANKARQMGAADRAFDLYDAAAVIEHRRNHRQKAMERWLALARAFPSHRRAGAVHLLAIIDAAELVRQDAGVKLDDYVKLLEEHLEKWPDDPTADKARLWLGKLNEYHGDWEKALAAYCAVSPADPQEYEQAVRAAARCYDRLLAGRKAAGEPFEEKARKAARDFEEVFLGPYRRPPERPSPIARFAAIAAARIWLSYTRAGFAEARGILETALDRTGSDAPEAWKSEARSLLVVALAGEGRRADAEAKLREISGGSPERLLEMLEGLSTIARSAQPQVRGKLAQLQLDVIGRLRPQSAALDAAGRLALDRIGADALAADGQQKEATGLYRRLAKENPDNGAVQESYAELLLAAGDQATLQTALAKWREVLGKSRPRSPRWYRAKYAVALAHLKLGQQDRAAKMIRMMLALYPDLGGPEMKRRFRALLARCEG